MTRRQSCPNRRPETVTWSLSDPASRSRVANQDDPRDLCGPKRDRTRPDRRLLMAKDHGLPVSSGERARNFDPRWVSRNCHNLLAQVPENHVFPTQLSEFGRGVSLLISYCRE